MTENNETNVEQTSKNGWTDPVTGKFVKGNPGGGRPLGSRDFRTIFYDAIKKIAKASKQEDLEDIEDALILKAISEAKNGNFQYFQDLMNRIHGKPVQPTTVQGEMKITKTLVEFIGGQKPEEEKKEKGEPTEPEPDVGSREEGQVS